MNAAITELIERTKSFLATRSQSYRQVFYGVHAERVLKDLAKFCRANESTFHPERSISDRLDGRREVWLRIQQHLNLSTDELWELYGEKRSPDKPGS